ncbi:hypothetical protein [Streptomyces collinus]|uniref:hypothetical protein n=1 Tax=Streptomyces collinus TaxID=42684 RepID=UPI003325433F
MHLLFTLTPHDRPGRRTTVTGCARQSLRLLRLAAETFPLDRLLCDAPATV